MIINIMFHINISFICHCVIFLSFYLTNNHNTIIYLLQMFYLIKIFLLIEIIITISFYKLIIEKT